MELLTSDVDDHNLEGVGRQTVESTAQGLPGRGSIWVQASKLRRPTSLYAEEAATAHVGGKGFHRNFTTFSKHRESSLFCDPS